ncbi:MAG: glycoside hydrolase family 3 protein [Oscillospiraceae bacterium]|nr:glycoside hydrolase family 3 protein [Oscillospiraceae bacterium]
MTLREKVGQLFIVRPEALATPNYDLSTHYKSVSAMSDVMRTNFGNYPVGGVALFADNILTPAQTLAFNKELLNACDIPLFIAVDEEGGRVARLANNSTFGLKKYASAAAVGAAGDASAALEMGNTIGAYLKKYGFNMDFAPDADVFTNPNNTVIGNRAFSSNAATAAKMAAAMAKGLRRNGIIPVYKHFPGHGDTSEDSHTGAAFANKTRDEMSSCEWLPFMEAGSLDGVMAGHISTPLVTGNNVPATMSKQMITDILRGELGFDGLVITDALAMGAITKVYSEKEAAVNAILAGCDILLLPDNLGESFDGLMSAVNDGTIPEARIDESVLRILKFKLEYGIIEV